MEFLCSFLRRKFAGKPVVASRNVCCLLRLWFTQFGGGSHSPTVWICIYFLVLMLQIHLYLSDWLFVLFLLSRDLNQVFDGIGYKIGMFVHAISTVLAGFALAFWYQWKLTLVLISVTPLLVVAGGILGKVTSSIILFKEPIRPET